MLHIKHQNPDPSSDFTRCTFAIKLYDKMLLQTLVEQGIQVIPVQLGVSFVHPLDSYVKSVGREKATEAVDYHDATLTFVEMRAPNRVVFHFTTHVIGPKNSVGLIDFGISYVPDSVNTRLEYIVMT